MKVEHATASTELPHQFEGALLACRFCSREAQDPLHVEWQRALWREQAATAARVPFPRELGS